MDLLRIFLEIIVFSAALGFGFSIGCFIVFIAGTFLFDLEEYYWNWKRNRKKRN